MANVLYSDTGLLQQGILVEESPYETLYRLQEAHWGLRNHRDVDVDTAIDWLRTRIAQPSRQLEWQRTECNRDRTGGYRRPSGRYARTTYLKPATGEAAINPFLTFAHAFLSAVDEDDPDGIRVRDNLPDIYPRPGRQRPELLAVGTFSCPPCTTQYQLALSRAGPRLYGEEELHFLRSLQEGRLARCR